MSKNIFKKIHNWWRAKIKFVEDVEKYRKEIEGGTLMRGGSFLKMVEKGEMDVDNHGHGRDAD